MKNVKCKINSGFSLVELIFAVIMLTVIVFGVVKLQTSNLALTNTQKNELQAHFLANEGAEIVEALGKTYIDTNCTVTCTKKINSSGSNYTLTDVGGTPEEIGAIPFERTVEISNDGLTSAYKITVLIQWTDSTGQHRKMSGAEVLNAHVEAKRIIF